MIGTGASATQFIPEIAPEVGELLVFQRTPAWLGPTPDYHDEVSDGLKWLYAHVPSYSEWNRFWIFWRMGDGGLPNFRVDPEWQSGRRVGERGERLRPPGARRVPEGRVRRPPRPAREGDPELSAGSQADAPRQRHLGAHVEATTNVRLVTDDIREITPKGVVTADGEEHQVDVLIYGTGFEASKFLTPMKVTGRDGIDLHEQWAGDARAYLGVTIPHFPNFFCLYGPNTNIVVNGSIIYFSECGVRYILGLLKLLLESGQQTIEVRKDVHDTFNEAVDAENKAMAWGWSDVNSWYKNEHGHVAQNWPFTLLEYWQRTLAPRPGRVRAVEPRANRPRLGVDPVRSRHGLRCANARLSTRGCCGLAGPRATTSPSRFCSAA